MLKELDDFAHGLSDIYDCKWMISVKVFAHIRFKRERTITIEDSFMFYMML